MTCQSFDTEKENVGVQMKQDESVKLLTRAEVEATFGISRRFLEMAAVKGNGPLMTRIGRRVMYAPSDIHAWLDRNKVASTSDTPMGEARP